MATTGIDPTDLSTHAGTWSLDPARTTVTFRTKAMWMLPVKGTIRALEGGGTVGPDGSIEGRLVLDVTSLSTGMGMRDKHLMSADFFDAAANPTIEFDLTGVRPAEGGRLVLDGTLLVHGERRPVSVDADVAVHGDSVTVTGRVADLDRREWNLRWAKMGAGVHNTVEVSAVFARSGS